MDTATLKPNHHWLIDVMNQTLERKSDPGIDEYLAVCDNFSKNRKLVDFSLLVMISNHYNSKESWWKTIWYANIQDLQSRIIWNFIFNTQYLYHVFWSYQKLVISNKINLLSFRECVSFPFFFLSAWIILDHFLPLFTEASQSNPQPTDRDATFIWGFSVSSCHDWN